MYKEDVELGDILRHIKESKENGYDLEFTIYYNRELKYLPDNKIYRTDEVNTIDYINFISEIYNHFRSIERQQLYEFQARLYQTKDDVNLYYELCAVRPFKGDAGYKRGGGSGTFSMKIYLTNRKLLLQQLHDLSLPIKYEEMGKHFIKTESPYFLDNISNLQKCIKSIIYKEIINELIDDNKYDLRQRKMKLEELKERILVNIKNNSYDLDDFEITIEESYDDFYFKIKHIYFGSIISLTQWKEVITEYHLDIDEEDENGDLD